MIKSLFCEGHFIMLIFEIYFHFDLETKIIDNQLFFPQGVYPTPFEMFREIWSELKHQFQEQLNKLLFPIFEIYS